MPVQLHASEYYEAIADDLITAWGLSAVDEDIFYGQPTSSTPNRYAVISLGSVPMDWDGLRSVEQTYEFQIVYWAPFEESEDWNVETAKEQRANALLAQLDHGALYNGSGVMPLVTSVVFDTGDDEVEDWYMVAVTFTLRRYAGV